MNSLEQISATLLGQRLREVRETAGKTQEEAAGYLGVARTTLVAIERGTRKARASELARLAEYYNADIRRILSQEQAVPNLVLQYRQNNRDEFDTLDLETTRALETLVGWFLALEQQLGVQLKPVVPLAHEIERMNIADQAEDLAQSVRRQLGFGPANPIAGIVAALEQEFGLKIFFWPLESSVSGAFAFRDLIGGCIVVNSLHHYHRQVRTLLHEVGHYMTTRETIDVLREDESSRVSEQFANRFADAFLIPAAGARRQFVHMKQVYKQISSHQILEMAQHFQVSLETMTRRLEEIGLIPTGSFDAVVKREQRRLPKVQISQRLRPTRFDRMAVAALSRNLISEGQACEFLGMDRLDVRDAALEFEEMGDVIVR